MFLVTNPHEDNAVKTMTRLRASQSVSLALPTDYNHSFLSWRLVRSWSIKPNLCGTFYGPN